MTIKFESKILGIIMSKHKVNCYKTIVKQPELKPKIRNFQLHKLIELYIFEVCN